MAGPLPLAPQGWVEGCGCISKSSSSSPLPPQAARTFGGSEICSQPAGWFLYMGCSYCSKHETACKRIVYRAFLFPEPLACGNSGPICPNTHFLSSFPPRAFVCDNIRLCWARTSPGTILSNPWKEQPSPTQWGGRKISAPSRQPLSEVLSSGHREINMLFLLLSGIGRGVRLSDRTMETGSQV